MININASNSTCQLKNAPEELEKILRKELRYKDQNADYQLTKGLKKLTRLNFMIANGKNGRFRANIKELESARRQLLHIIKNLEQKQYVYLYEKGIFATGLLPRVLNLLTDFDYEYTLQDTRQKPQTGLKRYILKESLPPLRYYQKEAAEELLEAGGRGIIVMPTGAGKSLTLCKIIWDMGLKTLVITPSKAITDLMMDTLTYHFGKSKVTKLTTKSGKTKDINVTNIQALVKIPAKTLKDIDLVFIDEFHHCLTGGSKIITDQGILTIKQIVENKIKCKVLSLNSNTNTWEYKTITNYFEYCAPKELLKIEYGTPTGSKTLVCTPNHKIYTTNRGYVTAEKLTTEDDIIVDSGFVCSICGKHYSSYFALGGCNSGHSKTPEQKIEEGKRMSKHPNHNNKSARKKNSESKKGENNPAKRLEVRRKKSVSQKRWFESLPKKEQEWRIKIFQNAPRYGVRKGPTSLEKQIIKLEIPEIKYTGDGKFWLSSNGRRMNPDFKIKNKRKVIEVGDTEYWHTQEDINTRIIDYKNINFECLYLTDKDLKVYSIKDLTKLIKGFIHG